MSTTIDLHARPQEELVELEADFRAEYFRVANALGVTTPQLEAAQLQHILAAQAGSLYDRSRVKGYLDQQFGGEFRKPEHFNDDRKVPSWGWRPLRQKDARRVGIAGFSRLPSRSDEILNTGIIYDRPVPLPVLTTALRIQEVFPDTRFFVSDGISQEEAEGLRQRMRNGRVEWFKDPFLAAQLRRDGELFIVEKWDEPGFRR
jgi:hypothetical protein